jgi:hypothetical protein
MDKLSRRVAGFSDFHPVTESVTPPGCCREVTIDKVSEMIEGLDPFTHGEAKRLVRELESVLNRKKNLTYSGILSGYDHLYYGYPDEDTVLHSPPLGNLEDTLSKLDRIYESEQLCSKIKIARTPNNKFTDINIIKNKDDYYMVLFRRVHLSGEAGHYALSGGRVYGAQINHRYVCDQLDCACLLIRWMIQEDGGDVKK